MTMPPDSMRHVPGISPMVHGLLQTALETGAGVGASSGSGHVGFANGLPMSIKIWMVAARVSPLTPCSFILIMLSARLNAEFKTVVTISRIAFVIMPESRPHIPEVSAGNSPWHALMHLSRLPGLS